MNLNFCVYNYLEEVFIVVHRVPVCQRSHFILQHLFMDTEMGI